MALATPSVPMRLVIGFGVLIVAGFTTGWLVFQQDRSTGWVEHTLVAQGEKTTTSVTRVAATNVHFARNGVLGYDAVADPGEPQTDPATKAEALACAIFVMAPTAG